MFAKVKNIHFVGIGGIGMSGIAEILINQGFTVSGSDMSSSSLTEHLQYLGATIYIGHQKDNIKNAEVVCYSSAVNPNENPETKAAIDKKIPIIRRAEMLAEVARLNYCVAISGTHGKTTTTSMVGLILIKAEIDPTVIVGGRLADFGGTNARLGNGKWTILEADEYDRSFLQLSPTIAIVNNIEPEHLDIYKDFDDIKETFTEFANKVPFYGFIALGFDDEGNREILSNLKRKVVTYGISRHCDIRATNIIHNGLTSEFDVIVENNNLGKIQLNIPGIHNIKNALAAITVAINMNIDFDIIKSAISEFKGVYRRFDIKGEKNGVLIVDDYAHHPTEVSSTLKAARDGFNKRIVACFQPHTYTRTQQLYKDFGKSFDDADVVIITDVYPARELPIEGVSGELIANAAIKYGHKNIIYVKNLNEAEAKIKEILQNNDLFITLGAGNVCNIADNLLK